MNEVLKRLCIQLGTRLTRSRGSSSCWLCMRSLQSRMCARVPTAASIRSSTVFLGRELGARTDDRSCYVEGKVQYDRLASTKLFREGLEQVAADATRHRIALLCAEKDPLRCHRTILVCRHLVASGFRVKHILEDGRLESHEDALSRLLAELGLPERDLFRSRNEIIEEAYTERGQQIAYTESTPEMESMRGVER